MCSGGFRVWWMMQGLGCIVSGGGVTGCNVWEGYGILCGGGSVVYSALTLGVVYGEGVAM